MLKGHFRQTRFTTKLFVLVFLLLLISSCNSNQSGEDETSPTRVGQSGEEASNQNADPIAVQLTQSADGSVATINGTRLANEVMARLIMPSPHFSGFAKVH